MANYHNKRKGTKKKKKKGEKKIPKLSLVRRGVFFVGWLGNVRVSSLKSGLESSLWALGLWQNFGFFAFSFVF